MSDNEPKPVNEIAFIIDITDMLFMLHIDEDIDEDKSQKIVDKFIENVTQKYKSEQVYIGSYLGQTIAKRDDEIFQKFTGKNFMQLAHEYGISTRSIRSAINRAKKRYIDKKQFKLL